MSGPRWGSATSQRDALGGGRGGGVENEKGERVGALGRGTI